MPRSKVNKTPTASAAAASNAKNKAQRPTTHENNKGHKNKQKKKSKLPSTADEVRALEQAILQVPENANRIITLLKVIERRSADSGVALAAVHSLRRVFGSLTEKGLLVSAKRDRADAGDDQDQDPTAGATELFQQWNRKQYLRYIQALLGALAAPPTPAWHEVSPEDDLKLRITALRTLMVLVSREHLLHRAPAGTFGNMTFLKLLRVLVRRGIAAPSSDSDVVMDQVLEVFLQEYVAAYDDVPLYTLRNLKNVLQSGVEEVPKALSNTEPSQTRQKKRKSAEIASTSDTPVPVLSPSQIRVCFRLLDSIELPDAAEELALCPELLCGFDDEEGALDEQQQTTGSASRTKKKKKKKFRIPAMDLKQHRAAFDGAWLAFLRLSLPKSTVKTVLFRMSTRILPRLEHPLALADFLTAALDYGGIIAVTAIHGIFLLVNEHGLNYEDFYEKLYSLLTPQIFLVKYRKKFFDLLWLFLRSSNLSANLIAAFCKRMARLALTAPPHGAVFAVALIFNLLQRHRACRALVDSRRRGKYVSVGSSFSESDSDSDSESSGDDEEEEAADANTNDGGKSAKTSKTAAPAAQGSQLDMPEGSWIMKLGQTTAAPKSNSQPEEDQEVGTDPFQFDSLDFEKCGALESSLWELKTLERSYCGTIASLITAFDHHLENLKFSLRIDDLNGVDYDSLIEQNIKKAHKVKASNQQDQVLFKRRRRKQREEEAEAAAEEEAHQDRGLHDADDSDGEDGGRKTGPSIRVALETLF